MLKLTKATLSTVIVMFSLVLSHVHAASEQHNIKIIFSGDMNEISSDTKSAYPQLSYLLGKHRTKNIPTFFFFGGGSIGPSMLSTFDRGSHIIDLLNQIEPDVMATTKRDFSFLEDELSLRAFEAAFPIVSSNITVKNSTNTLNGILPYVITQQGDYKIAVLSTLAKSSIQEYNLKRIDILDKVSSVKKQVDLIKQNGIDLIVLINTGIENDVESLLEDGTVDLILQKDSNVEGRNEQDMPKHPQYIFVSKVDEIAVINLSWQSNRQKDFKLTTDRFRYGQLFKEQKMQLMVEQYESRLDNLLDEVIGVTLTAINTQRSVVRRKESAFGNLLTDALKEHTSADIAIVNGGTIRGERNYVPNERISRRDIISELPYRSDVVLLEVTGDILSRTIEHGLSGMDTLLGRFLQVSGLQVTFDGNKPAGQRLISLKHNGSAVNPNQKYKLVVSDYLANGGDNFTMLENKPKLEYKGQKSILISDILVNFIRTRNEVAPRLENRIVNVSNSNNKLNN